MSENRIALFPASFDPITNGHLDIARRARGIFGEVVLAVAVNIEKSGTFSVEERLETLRVVTAPEAGMQVVSFTGLTVDFAREVGANVIIRGVRAMSDFEYEFEMALMNKHLRADVETLFMMPSQEPGSRSSRASAGTSTSSCRPWSPRCCARSSPGPRPARRPVRGRGPTRRANPWDSPAGRPSGASAGVLAGRAGPTAPGRRQDPVGALLVPRAWIR
jgi:pantetheine-phosphate adenylyltransferase